MERHYFITSFVFVMTCQLVAAGPTSPTVIIPSKARLGYVVTVLDLQEGESARLLRTDNTPEVYNTFSLQPNGWLVTKRRVVELSGTNVIIVYRRMDSGGTRSTEKLNVLVTNSPGAASLPRQPYIGYIEENSDPGSEIRGLHDFQGDLKKLPYGCWLDLMENDANLVSLDIKSGSLTAKIALDREQRAFLSLGIRIKCGSRIQYAAIGVCVTDVNDNTPQMDNLFYDVSLSRDQIQNALPLLRVHATDPDEDRIVYGMEEHPDFVIDPETGDVSAVDVTRLLAITYELTVFAVDESGHVSEPSFVRIEVTGPRRSTFRRRRRRAVRPTKTFVVRRTQEGDLFTVADDYENTADEQFEFYSPDPEGLDIDRNTGMVSVIPGFSFNETMIEFRVNVTRDNDPGFEDDQPVEMYIVDRTWRDPIFTNQPEEMFVTIPEWIRPDTVIYTVQAIDSQEPYFAPVNYQIEAGDEGCFKVDLTTGDVMVDCRRQFVINKRYRLALSAQNKGAAITDATPTQILTIQVGVSNPTFYTSYDNVRMSETTAVGESVVTIECISHQNVPITFELQYEDNVSPGVFNIDANTGVVTLNKQLQHIRDPHQYRMKVTATESHTGYSSTTDLIINLDGENLYAPYFPGTVYPTESDIAEDMAVGTTVIQVEAVDLDFGENGLMEFVVSDSHFSVTSLDGKIANVIVASPLDYDRIPLHRYDVTLTAVDRGIPRRSATTQLQIWMKDVADEAPVLEPSTQIFRLNQDAGSDTLIHVIQAYDPDVSDTITFSFGDDSNQQGPYDLDRATGYLTLNRGLTLDDATNLTIKVKDNNGMESSGNVIIEVIGVNHPPQFPQCASYTSVTLKEHEPVGTSVLNLTVLDTDVGVNGELTFDVYSSLPTLKIFRIGDVINEGNGIWTVTVVSDQVIDREAPAHGWDYVNGEVSYQATVLAKDDGSPSLATTCFFFVRIEDINDQDPMFDESRYRVTIPASLGADQRVIRLFAVDVDVGDNADFRYSLHDDSACPGCFNLDPNTGWITRTDSGTLDVDQQYVLQVTWTTNALTGTPTEVAITVKDAEPDLPPVWNDYQGTPIDDVTGISIMENQTRGEIPSLNFTTNKAGILETVPGATPYENGENHFSRVTHGETSLTLTVIDDLDYETVPKYSVRIRASMKGISPDLPFTDARISIDLMDVNDKTPQFVGTDQSRTYPAGVSDQTKPGDDVIKVTAIDGDGTAAHNTVMYNFSSTCTGCDAFSINMTSGLIKAKTTYSPDVTAQYFLVVVGTDNSPSPVNNNQPLSATATVRVEVTGTITNSPYFEEPFTIVTLDSGVSLNTTIHTLVAIDPTGQSSLQYSILEGNTDRDFAVDISTGDIYTVHEILYEITQEYNLTCAVFDGINRRTTIINVRLSQRNVYPPHVTPTRWYEVSNVTEDDTSRIILAAVSAVDPEGDTSLVYSIQGSYVDQGFFSIEGDRIYKEKSLDRDYPDGHARWMLTVSADDSSANPAILSGYGLLIVRPIDVDDSKPWFDNCCLIGYVDEGAPKGTLVLQLVVHDYDAGGNTTLTFGAVIIPENDSGQKLFLVEASGSIKTDVAGGEFNREITPRYTAVVYVQDNGGTRVNQTVDIIVNDVNNNEPVFDAPSYYFEVDEQLPVGSRVGAVYVTDNDTSTLSQLVFTIVSSQSFFYIDSLYLAQAGVIRTAQILDYENASIPSRFELTISVTDGAASSTTAVIIEVRDVNDNAPVITPPSASVTIDENTLNNNIQQYTAIDQDTAEGGIFDFLIDYENTDPDKKFWIDPSSGIVSVIQELDWEKTSSYNIRILAVDKGVPPMTGTATLIVDVTNLDDSPPFGLFDPPLPVVDSTTIIDDEVLTVTVTDSDSSIQDTSVEFTCNEPFCNDFAFSYTPDTGTGIISAARDGYNRLELGFDFYDLTFTFRDKTGNSASQAVRIYIRISNTEAHTSGQSTIYVFNYRASLPDTDIGRVYCDDPEGWDTADKTFTPEQDYADFNISSKDGTITMRRGAPRGEHILSVQVFDNVHQVSAVCSVNIYIYYIYDKTVDASGSIRIIGITPEDFIVREEDENGNLLSSKYDLLQQELANLVQVTTDDVTIFTVVNSSADTIDVIYAIQNPFGIYYRPSKINGLVWLNKDRLSGVIGGTIASSPISLCRDDSCFGSGCNTMLDVAGDAILINTPQTTLVGIAAAMISECVCPDTTYVMDPPKCQYYTCANNGTCDEYYNGYRCECLEDFEGPHCEQTKLSFSAGNWAWFDHLPACEVMKISFDILTSTSDGLLLYNGPMYSQSETSNRDYLAVQLVGGYPALKVDVGNDNELELSLNGEDQSGNVIMPPLNDGRWHTIEVFKNHTEFTLTVDHCSSVEVNETLEYSDTDRTPCEVTAVSEGVHSLINVYTPLELGGRASTQIDYPTGISGNTFAGCIRYVWINGMLYDLHIGDVGEALGTTANCPQEGCDQCPPNSTCSGSLGGSNPVCTCLPGFIGADCSSEAPVGDFTSETSFVEWEIKDTINTTFGLDSFEITQLSLQFRTRQDNGIIFEANSFSTLERIILEVVTSYLQCRYDLGEGDQLLSLPYVNVSDGTWHTVLIRRYGNQVMMWLDGSEGKYQSEIWPYEGFRHLVIARRGTYGGARVQRNIYSQQVTTSMVLANSCIRDVRLNQIWIPMFTDQNPESDLADVIDFSSMDDICDSDACNGITCPPGLICRDIWRENICICPEGEMFDEKGVCVPITDCSIPRCVWGDCVLVPDPDNPGELIWRCNCYEGWTGVHCNETDPVFVSTMATVSTGWISSVTAALLLLLILLLIVVCCTKKKKAGLLDEPDFAKEFVMEYNEDGGGEEDMQAYDLRPLQKPVEVMKPLDTDRAPLVEELPRTAPEPLHAERPPLHIPPKNDKELPDIGQFIEGRLGDADNDRNVPPYDSVREYEYEGDGSLAQSLSSIQTSSSGGDQDMDYLLSFGAPFSKLADLYLGGSDEEDEEDLYKGDHPDARRATTRPRVVEYTDRARDIAQELAYKRALAAETLRSSDTPAPPIPPPRKQMAFQLQEPGYGDPEQRLAGAWQEENRQTLSRDETRASLRESRDILPSGDIAVVEEPTERQQTAGIYHPDPRIDVHEEEMGGAYSDKGSDYHETGRARYQDVVMPYQHTGLRYQDTQQEQRTSHHSVQRTVKTTRVVQQRSSTQQLTAGQDAVARYSGQDGDMTVTDGAAYQQFMDQQLYSTSAAPSSDSMIAASARMVKTEHVTWTESKQLRQLEDYSEV